MKKTTFLLAGLLFCWGQILAKYSIEKINSSNNCCNGSLTAYATGNSGPYTFDWTKGGNPITSAEDDETFSKLTSVCAGTYYVTITNGYGCQTILDVSFPSNPFPIPICATELSVLELSEPLKLDVKVFLEGPYNMKTNEMNAKLMTRGLLPGQTPLSSLATPTPVGQPYNVTPFLYNGIEGKDWTDNNYTQNDSIVDWVLVSLRSDIEKSSTLETKAGVLIKDGTIKFPVPFEIQTVHDSLRIVVEHRNHLSIISQKVAVEDGLLSHNFTLEDSYTETNHGQNKIYIPALNGQETIDSIYVMYSGNILQTDNEGRYDIRGSDKDLWSILNGSFDKYETADINLDGDIKGEEKILWEKNNGIYGMQLAK